MGVQRIQETSAASYGKSVEAATSGSSNAVGGNSVSQSVENIMTTLKTKLSDNADIDVKLGADKVQETRDGVKTNEQIRKAVEEINRKAHNSEVVFGIHDATNRVTIKIVDKDTKKVLKEYPPEKTLDMIAKVWEVAGLLVDEKL